MRIQRIVLAGSAAVVLVFSSPVMAGKGGGGQGGMGGMGMDAPKFMTEERVRVEKGKQEGELVRERHEGVQQGPGKGAGGGRDELQINKPSKDW